MGSNLTRVNQISLTRALNGDTAVADAVGNVVNGASMNAFQPLPNSSAASGVYATIGTLIYVEMTLVYNGGGKPQLQLPFTHQTLSDQRAIIPGASGNGVAITGNVPPGSSILTLSRYDGAALDAGTYYVSGCYESDVG